MLFSVSCHRNVALERALTFAGDNRQELEKVLAHYKDDSLKLAAARFLIENMPYHFYKEEYYVLPGGKKYRPQLADFPTEEACEAHLDSLARERSIMKRDQYRDSWTLDSAFLVSNIDLAFEVWQKPWARKVPFDIFCRYILPYSISRERPSGLRKEMMERFVPLLDSAGVTTPLEACSLLNMKLRTVMKYIPNSLPYYPTIEETYAWGGGLCKNMCDLGLFAMRAAGIPVALEQTVWTRMDFGHTWGAVWSEGRFHCFAPGEELPGEYTERLNGKGYLRPAKVYRSHFEPCSSASGSGEEVADDGYSIWLKNALLEDVSPEYLAKPIEIRVTTDRVGEFAQPGGLVYLCAYNHYEWVPVATGCRTDTVCRFDRVGGDNIFLVADSPTGRELRFLTIPFYVDKDGKVRRFTPRLEQRESFTFSKELVGRPHTLHYWDVEAGAFLPLDYDSADDSTQSYTNLPGNALLWFYVPDCNFSQRVFYLENGEVIAMHQIR